MKVSDYLIDIIESMIHNLDEGEYDGCNGPWDREMIYDIERHPSFKNLNAYPKTPTSTICSDDILNLIKYVYKKRKESSNGAP